MASEARTGSRIRARRVMEGLKQAELARRAGISGSYLNLIEHNRRRIGGKLLLSIAAELGVEPRALTDGAEAVLLGSLREAALAAGMAEGETNRADEFAGRFPAWAAVLASSQRRVLALEQTVEALSDRMAHDPHLANSMHELLTTAAAIRSTAAILVETKSLEPEWRERFHTNIDEDSRRLADSAQSLVGYLELDTKNGEPASSPQEEVEAWLAMEGYHFAALEEPSSEGPKTITRLLADRAATLSAGALYIARGVLEQSARDAKTLPIATLEHALKTQSTDPVALARAFRVGVPVVLRRLASLPDLGAGLVMCDRSGTVIFRKSVNGFSVPRLGACCPLWPLFAALAQPGQVVREHISQLGRSHPPFEAIASTEVQAAPEYNRAPLHRAVMLILPGVPSGATPVQEVGATCRICPRTQCGARREPSILADPDAASGF